MTTYCAPCLADLALVREAVTAVGGTASCMAHAVLLTHPADDPQRRRQRLAQLRDTATEKLPAVGPEERVRLEILVEEYSLASAMESLVPRRRPDGHRAGDRPGERSGERPGPRPVPGETPLSRSARKRRVRENRDRVAVPGAAPSGAPMPAAAEAAGQVGSAVLVDSGVSDAQAEQVGAEALAQVGAPAGDGPATAAGAIPEASAPADPATAAGARPQTSAPADPATAAGARPQTSAPADPATPAVEPPDHVGQDAGSGGSGVGAAGHDERP